MEVYATDLIGLMNGDAAKDVSGFKPRSDLGKLDPNRKQYLGTALYTSGNAAGQVVVAMFGKPKESFDKQGTLEHAKYALTTDGVREFREVRAREGKPVDPTLNDAELAIMQRRALMADKRHRTTPAP